MSVEDENIDYAALREQQTAQCEAMGTNELAAYWNGFPPSCSVLNPMALKSAVENGDAQSPITQATECLEATYGEQKTLNSKNIFNTAATSCESDNVAGLIFDLGVQPS